MKKPPDKPRSNGKWEFIITAICVYSVIAYKFPDLTGYDGLFLYVVIVTGVVSGIIVAAAAWLADVLKMSWVSWGVIIIVLMLLSGWAAT